MPAPNKPNDGEGGWGPWMRALLDTLYDGVSAAATVDELASKADNQALATGLAAKADLVSGKIPASQLPALTIGGTRHDVANQAAMLALTGLGNGDWSVWADGSVYLYAGNGADPSQMSSWTSAEQASSSKVTSLTTSSGTHTGAVVLNAAEVAAVASSAVGAAGGVAPLDNTSKVPAANLPAPVVASVAGKTGAVTLTATDVGAAPAAGSPNYAAAAAAHPGRFVLGPEGPILNGQSIFPLGIPVEQGDTGSAAAIWLGVPSLGQAEAYNLDVWRSGAVVSALAATITVPQYSRGVPITWTPTLQPGDLILCHQVGNTGTDHGQAPALQLAFNSNTIPAQTAPATPTNVTVTRSGTTNTVTWPTVTGAYTYLVWRSGTFLTETYLTSVTDALGGASDTYRVAAAVPRAASAPCTAVGVGASNVYTGFPAGASSPTGFGPLIVGTGGTTPTTAPTDAMQTVNGNLDWILSTGSTGSANKNDDLGREFTGDTAAHLPWDVSYLIGASDPLGSNGLANNFQIDVALTAAHLVNTWALTSIVGLRIDAAGITPFIKSTAAGSATFNGTTTTIPANTFTGLAKQTYTITADSTHDFGLRTLTTLPGDGTLVARVYWGTVTQLQAGTLPQLGGDIVINAAAVAGIPAGYHWHHIYGKQGAGQAGVQSVRLGLYTIKAG